MVDFDVTLRDSGGGSTGFSARRLWEEGQRVPARAALLFIAGASFALWAGIIGLVAYLL